jgi:hypothetical protein
MSHLSQISVVEIPGFFIRFESEGSLSIKGRKPLAVPRPPVRRAGVIGHAGGAGECGPLGHVEGTEDGAYAT